LNLKNTSIVFYSLFLFSCLDNSNGDPPTTGEASFNSEIINFKFSAFSFSEGKVIKYPNSQGLIPDIILLVHSRENGNINGVYLSSLDLRPTFNYQYWSTNIDSTQIYFDNLLEISDTVFTGMALPVKENQVWAIMTRDGKYGKILIKYTLAKMKDSTPYGEIQFKWEYQPDGTNNF
jgi:hypothetical protein|tara:strand:- start:55 stop:585 length:531 start_codon:yes stop_codon:yes gene_type:complete